MSYRRLTSPLQILFKGCKQNNNLDSINNSTPYIFNKDIIYHTIPYHELDSLHPRYPPRPLGPHLTHLHLPRNGPSDAPRVRPRWRLSRLQIPHLVLVRRLDSFKTRLLPASYKAVPHNTRRAMSQETRRELCWRCGAG